MVESSMFLFIIINVFKAQKDSLMTVLALAAAYILISALVIFNVEPQTFETFFDAIYWATVSLTTMGYGDIYPITDAGKLFAIVISFLGVGMVAIPTGIISAGFVDQYSRIKRISEYGDEEDIHFIMQVLFICKSQAQCSRLIQ